MSWRHTERLRERLIETMGHMRADVEKEPQFKAPFETSAEVLGGLVKAVEHYEKQNGGACD